MWTCSSGELVHVHCAAAIILGLRPLRRARPVRVGPVGAALSCGPTPCAYLRPHGGVSPHGHQRWCPSAPHRRTWLLCTRSSVRWLRPEMSAGPVWSRRVPSGLRVGGWQLPLFPRPSCDGPEVTISLYRGLGQSEFYGPRRVLVAF